MDNELLQKLDALINRWEATADNLDEMNQGDWHRMQAIRNCCDELSIMLIQHSMEKRNDLPSTQA